MHHVIANCFLRSPTLAPRCPHYSPTFGCPPLVVCPLRLHLRSPAHLPRLLFSSILPLPFVTHSLCDLVLWCPHHHQLLTTRLLASILALLSPSQPPSFIAYSPSVTSPLLPVSHCHRNSPTVTLLTCSQLPSCLTSAPPAHQPAHSVPIQSAHALT